MKDFIALDFETANGERSSVCSIGCVFVKDGEMVDSFYSLIHPRPNYYAYFCQEVHGLGRNDTDDAPDFPEVWQQVEVRIREVYFQNIPCADELFVTIPFVAHNSPFDEGCLRAVFAAYRMPYPKYSFFDTLRKSRQVWPEGRHNLDIIAAYCGYDLTNHHHALADAEACAVIALKIL